MAKIQDKIVVIVSEAKAANPKLRQINVQIEAAQSLFSIADLLAKEGAIEALQTSLKRGAKQLIMDYIQNGKLVLQAVRTASTKLPSTTLEVSRPTAEARD